MDEKLKKDLIDEILKHNQQHDFGKESNPFIVSYPLLDIECPKCKTKGFVVKRGMLLSAYSGSLTCQNCNWHEGFVTYLGKSMFPIQELPKGAEILYDKEDGEVSKYVNSEE